MMYSPIEIDILFSIYVCNVVHQKICRQLLEDNDGGDDDDDKMIKYCQLRQ